MNCGEFLERFSEFRDRDEEGADPSPFEAHLRECASCARYKDVVERGVELARSFTGPKPREDFDSRLRHRIYQADLTAGGKRRDGSTPFVSVALAAAAVLAVVGAWGSIASTGYAPSVDLPAISAAAPVIQASPESPATRERAEGGVQNPAFLTRSDLWDQSHLLLYEHSTLYHRSREGSLIRTGLH